MRGARPFGEIRWLLAVIVGLGGVLCVSGCASRGSPIPLLAREQVPASGSPAAAGEWVARDGRLTLVGGGRRISARVALQHRADGRVRLGVITDEGIILADVIVDGEAVTVQALRPEITPTLEILAHVVRQTWVTPHDTPRLVGDVMVGQWSGLWGDSERIYAGDPVLLRSVSGAGPKVFIEDYRVEPQGLIAHAVRAEGLGYTLQMTIAQIGLTGTATAPAAAPAAIKVPAASPGEKAGSADHF